MVNTRAVRVTSTWLARITSVQEKNAELRGQLGVVEEYQQELEALRLKCSSAVVEKARTEEKLLAASNQVIKLEAREAKRQLHEAEVCEGAIHNSSVEGVLHVLSKQKCLFSKILRKNIILFRVDVQTLGMSKQSCRHTKSLLKSCWKQEDMSTKGNRQILRG